MRSAIQSAARNCFNPMTPKPKQAVAAIRLPVTVEYYAYGGWAIVSKDDEIIYSVGGGSSGGLREQQARQIAHALNSLPGTDHLLKAARNAAMRLESMCAGVSARKMSVKWQREDTQALNDLLKAICDFETAAEKGMV